MSVNPVHENTGDHFNKMMFNVARNTIIVRVTLAALGAFAAYKGGSVLVLSLLGLIVSPPAVMIAFGGKGVYAGSIALISSVATGSLASLALGLTLIPLGGLAVLYGLTRKASPLMVFSL